MEEKELKLSVVVVAFLCVLISKFINVLLSKYICIYVVHYAFFHSHPAEVGVFFLKFTI